MSWPTSFLYEVGSESGVSSLSLSLISLDMGVMVGLHPSKHV